MEKNDFHATRHRVEINLLVHLKPTDNIIFDRMHAVGFISDAIRVWSHDSQNSRKVEETILRAGVISIVQQIIHPISINLTGDHLHDLRIRIGVVDNRCDHLRKFRTDTTQNFVHVRMRIRENCSRNRLVISVENVLKCMRIGTMADIVQQGGTQHDWPFGVIP